MSRIVIVTIMMTLIAAPTTAFSADPFGFTEEQYSSWGITEAPYPFESADRDGNYLDYGCFPVGNGLVFGHLGVDGDFNKLRGLTGPGYQTREDDGKWAVWQEGNWFDQPVVLTVYDEDDHGEERFFDLNWTAQSIQSLRGTAMVRSVFAVGSTRMYCLTYAVPGSPVLVREMVLFHEGELPGTLYGSPEFKPEMLNGYTMTYTQGDNVCTITGSNAHDMGVQTTGRTPSNNRPWFEFLPAEDGSLRLVLAYTFTKKGEQVPAQDLDPTSIAKLRDQTFKHWRDWTAGNLQYNTGDQRLDDMMIQLPVIIETQRDYYSGGVSPMVSYHGYWVRDNLGPILTYLVNGRFDNVMQMLRYHRAGSLQYGKSHMMIPLDLDLSNLPGWRADALVSPTGDSVHSFGLDNLKPAPDQYADNKPKRDTNSLDDLQRKVARPRGNIGNGEPDDTPPQPKAEPIVPKPPIIPKVTVPRPALPTAGDLSRIGTKAADWNDTGVEHAEVPSLIVLQHYLLWRAMTDAGQGAEADAFIREAWAFITHNLFTMEFHPDYGVAFHGDETYTQGALYSTYDRVESGQIGYPNGYIPTEDFTSFDNTLLHRAAAASIVEMAQATDLEGEDEAFELQNQLAVVIDGFFTGSHYAPAISTVTGQRWSAPYANISLRPYWLDLPYGDFEADLNYSLVNWALDDTSSTGRPMTTPWSGYHTGHQPGAWLNAHTALGNSEAASDALGVLLESATPEGAWCEIYAPSGRSVDIYDRTNRIRPWESGINYAAMVTYLGSRDRMTDRSLQVTINADSYDEAFREAHTPENTRVLVITTSTGWEERVRLDTRFKTTPIEQLSAWDAGLPFSHNDLRGTLLEGASADDDLRIPFLYFDSDVRGDLDRRTFKDQDFWQGEEMQTLLADYRAAGGTVLDKNTLRTSLAFDEAVTLKVLVTLYPNTFTYSMSDEEIALFHQEMAQWINWYDEVAGNNLRLEFDYLQINTRLNPQMSGPQGNNIFWLDYGDVEPHLLERGIEHGAYDAVACFWAWDRETPVLDGEVARQAYGGAAQGPADDMDFLGLPGETAYFGSAVLNGHMDRTSKNATHEFLHNVDAMFELIGEERLSHPDQMSLNMGTLLAEVPGGFEHLGYSDDDMRQLVADELANKIHYPWPTQLVYYQQALDRVPRASFGRLALRFGERKTRRPRRDLYENFILPAGVEPYQVRFVESPELAELVLTDVDFVNEEDLVHEFAVWAGAAELIVPDPDLESPEVALANRLRTYEEGMIVCDDVVELIIGDGEKLTCRLIPEPETFTFGEVDVWLELGEDNYSLKQQSDGAFAVALPITAGTEGITWIHAEQLGYVITPVPVEFTVGPPWQLEARFGLGTLNRPQLILDLDGPAGDYAAEVEIVAEFNTVQRLLAADGLIKQASLATEAPLIPGESTEIAINPPDFETLHYLPVEVTVTMQREEDPPVRFTHHFPGEGVLSELIAGLDSEKLPDYVLRANSASPTIDGNLGDWAGPPAIVLSIENGNVFSGTIDGVDDAALVLWLGYDEEFLYAAGGVKDEMMPGNGSWDSDRINLAFDALGDTTPDTYPDGAAGHNAWAKDDYWVFLNPLLPDGPQSMRLGGERPSGGKNGYYGPVAGAKSAVIKGEDNYTFEWAIPLEELPYLTPEPGSLCGFTLFYSDFDESLAELMYVTNWAGPDGIEWRFWDCGLLYFN